MTAITSRPLYRPDELVRVFAPRSIAVVGVSTNSGSFGSSTYANIASKGRFGGHTYAVNAKYDWIGDARCYPSISALPETPDCVFGASSPTKVGRAPGRRVRTRSAT